jgi:hypothetical protein
MINIFSYPELRFKELNEKISLPERDIRISVETLMPEIVYALTNGKGRTRAERANDHYYEGIRKTRLAPFVKMCDRMANIRYGTLFAGKSRIFDIYRKDHWHFIDSIGKGTLTPVPRGDGTRFAANAFGGYGCCYTTLGIVL